MFIGRDVTVNINRLKSLINRKQRKIIIQTTPPRPGHGKNGDIVIARMHGSAMLFIKLGGSWYSSQLERVKETSYYNKDGVGSNASIINNLSVDLRPRYTYTTSAGANTTIYQIPIVLPSYSVITDFAIGIKKLSDTHTYSLNIWRSDTDGLAINSNLGSVSGNHTEILGAGAANTRSTDSTGSATDIDIGTNANDLNKLWYTQSNIDPIGTGSNYLYVANAGILNGAVDAVDDLTPSPSGAWQASQSHTNQSQTGTDGAGAGSKWAITTDGSGNPTFTLDTSNRGHSHTDNEQLTFTDPGSTSNTAVLRLNKVYQPARGIITLSIKYFCQPVQASTLSRDKRVARMRTNRLGRFNNSITGRSVISTGGSGGATSDVGSGGSGT